MIKTTKNNFLILTVRFLVLLAISTLSLPNKIYAIPLALLAIIAILYTIYTFFIIHPSSYKKFIRNHGIIISTFLVFIGCSLFFYFYHAEKLSFLDKSAKLVGFCFVLVLLIDFPIKINSLLISINIAAIVSGSVAIYQIYYLSFDRAFADTMAIQGGDISMSLGLFSAFICYFFYQTDKKKSLIFSLLAAILGILGSFLSGSRGGWICLPPLFIFLIYFFWSRINRKVIMAILTIVVVSGFIIVLNKNLPGVFYKTYNNLSMYYKDENKKTSVGYRLELWKSAFYSWQDKPMLGWGEKNIIIARQKQAQERKIMPDLYKTKFSAHNQFLEELSVRGIISFCCFIYFLFIPFLLFAKYRKEQNSYVRIMSNLGMLHIYLISTYCLTQAFFIHNSGIMFYSLMVVVLYSSLCEHAKNHNKINKKSC